MRYAEDDGDEASGSEADEDARRAAVAMKNAAVAALLEPEEIKGMDDEVERVLSHRSPPPAPPRRPNPTYAELSLTLPVIAKGRVNSSFWVHDVLRTGVVSLLTSPPSPLLSFTESVLSKLGEAG